MLGLKSLPRECEWVEFKHNNGDPQRIGEYISALSNAAALAGKSHGYLLWGIADKTHEVVGTDFVPEETRRGGEDLGPWLLRSLSPQVPFQFLSVTIGDKPIIVLKIGRAYSRPTSFFGEEYIRVSSYKKKLKDAPELERSLWKIFDYTPFEKRIAVDDVDESEILKLLDLSSYFDLLRLDFPTNTERLIEAAESEGLIAPEETGRWSILNLGAILFARNIEDFPLLRRKAVRVISYTGKGRIETTREQVERKGYAAGFQDLINNVNGLVPANEIIGKAIRSTVPMYPSLSIRELVANALIHQDFEITGAGPTIEIFSDRMEITNPGEPLMAVDRMLDAPPRSRNEALASLMRRFGICEERGSGIDKVVQETEIFQLPAPEFAVFEQSFRATMFAHRKFNDMDKSDRIRACYMHASLRYVMRDYMTNSTLRERFGIDPRNSAIASRLIKEALEAELIRPYDVDAGRRFMKYIPWWAKSI
ncbi:transcriptional regulator [Parapusillimonas sp. SGNA-6]|nr:transcriptional regulator [Parapusillimonas sp. SGNA-6]